MGERRCVECGNLLEDGSPVCPCCLESWCRNPMRVVSGKGSRQVSQQQHQRLIQANAIKVGELRKAYGW